MWETFVFESQISHAIKKQKNFFIKTTKGNAGLSEKEAREFSLLYFIFKTFKILKLYSPIFKPQP